MVKNDKEEGLLPAPSDAIPDPSWACAGRKSGRRSLAADKIPTKEGE